MSTRKPSPWQTHRAQKPATRPYAEGARSAEGKGPAWAARNAVWDVARLWAWIPLAEVGLETKIKRAEENTLCPHVALLGGELFGFAFVPHHFEGTLGFLVSSR